MPFKNGAFKMAHKAGAPVIPISICGAANVMPSYWMFPYRPAGGGACTVVVHEPVESKGKTEEELAVAVRESIIAGLPEEQRPLAVEMVEATVEEPSKSTITKVDLATEAVISESTNSVPAVPEDQIPLQSA
jgi:1-acyl-sn-glycerol-3-phosphate acyltransferase